MSMPRWDDSGVASDEWRVGDVVAACGRIVQAEGFWEVYSHVIRPNDVQTALDLHLFRDGIKPIWEVCGVWQLSRVGGCGCGW